MTTLGALSVAQSPSSPSPLPRHRAPVAKSSSLSLASSFTPSSSHTSSFRLSLAALRSHVLEKDSVDSGCGRRFRIPQCSAKVQHGKDGALRIMISGAPASGKGTQCELIVQQFKLTHISAGDLLRAEVAAGTEAGKEAQEYMQRGQLVPDKTVVTMVKNKLMEAQHGWLLDGYPRSLSQAQALEAFDIHPQLFILLEVPDEILVQRVIGRRLDPVTGKIYHLLYSPPETPEIAARLTQRMDDTEEKCLLRLKTHKSNVEAVVGAYASVIRTVDGNRPKDQVFSDIKNLISELQGKPEKVGVGVVSGGL